MKNKPLSHLVAGAVIAGAGIVLFLTYFYTGLSFETNFLSYVPALITIILLIFFVIQYGSARNNDVTFGNLFGYGFKTTIIYALIMIAFLLLVNYLLPSYKEKFMEQMASQMDKDGKLSDDQRELAVNTTKRFFLIGMIGGGLFINMIIGTIGSLIGAALARKNPRTPFENQV